MVDNDGDGPRSLGEAYEMTMRAIAGLELAMQNVTVGQKEVRAELRPLSANISALAAQLERMGSKLHKTNNVMQILVNEAGELHQCKLALDRALDFFEGVQNAEKMAARKEERIEVEARLAKLRAEAVSLVDEDDSDRTEQDKRR